jgi:RNA polymerase sigma-70 factor (ECF subfamily)
VRYERDHRSDEALVEAASGGDAEAFEALYRRHRDWVVRLARRFTGNDQDALDVLQETWRYFIGKLPGLRLRARMTTFLYPVVRNLSISIIRRRRGHVRDEAVLSAIPAAEPSDPTGGRSELAAAMSSLPDAQRETLLMRYVDDMSLQEIAEALGVPLGTVKSRIHNALAALREDPRARRFFGAD